MRKRLLCLFWIGFLLFPAFSLAAETPALSLRADPGCLRLIQGNEILREWPLGKPTAIDLYWDESYVYAQVALDEEDAAPVLLCFAYDAEGWSVEGMDCVRWRGAPTPELWKAWGMEDIERSPDGLLPSEISLENSNLLPCGLHTKDSVPPEEQAMHSALQPCGQAYECDTSHVHMVYDCGAHYSCQGGDPAEHQKYETCDHYRCDGMPHPVLDCGIHSVCDADPSEHALLSCGHFRCDPTCDCENALPTPAADPSDSGG